MHFSTLIMQRYCFIAVLLPFFLKIVCPVFTFSLFYVVVAVGTVLFVVLMVVNMS